MAGTGARASEFERELRDRSEPYFRAEVTELERFARESLELERLEPWDVAFASEHLRKARTISTTKLCAPTSLSPTCLMGSLKYRGGSSGWWCGNARPTLSGMPT